MLSLFKSSNELKVLADSLTKISRLQRISGSVKFKGVLDIDLDTVISLSGFGNRFDGNVYVSHVSHEIEEGKIFTEIEFGLREDFFNQKAIFDKKNLTNNISGLYIGQVIQIDNDPENQNRIKVQIPALNDVGDGIWARLTHFYTGENNGIFFIPETGTQVVISFIANDSRNPVVLGCLYTNSRKPYESINENNNLKCFMTKSNLKIEFKEDEKEISISTPSGNKIFLNEIGYIPSMFSYPFGEYSEFMRDYASKNFKYAFGQHSGVIDLNKEKFQLPRFPINENYGKLERFKTIINTFPLEYKKLLPIEKKIGKQNNPPNFQVEFFREQKNIANITCFSNEGDIWKKSEIQIKENILTIKFREAFKPRRGRINCSLNDKGKWRWFGTQFIIKSN